MGSNEWQQVKLGEVCSKIGSGSTPKGGANAYCPSGISFIRSQNVLDFSFSDDGLVYINDEQGEKLNNVTVEKNDVLINITGDSVARACIVPNYRLPARVNQHVAIIRGKEECILNKYILYYLQFIKSHLLQMASAGATRNALTKSMLENLEVKLPSLDKQIIIINILSHIDEKINLNNKINDKLQTISQLLFKHWFVDFEFPNEEGLPYKSSGGEMVDSELGMIPKGWEVKKMQEIIDVRDGTHASPKPQQEGYPLITSKHLLSSGIDFSSANLISQEDYDEVNKRSKVNTGDILITMIGTVGNIYRVDEKNINFAIKNVGLFKTSDNNRFADYIYLCLESESIKRYIFERLAGSTQQYISLGELRKIPVIIPDEVLDKFNELIKPILKKTTVIKEENKNLSTLRDTLLPKLMSGEIDLSSLQI